MKKVWLITGSSKGLGRSLAETALKKGDLVAATARNPEQLKDLSEQFGEQLYLAKLDVTDFGNIPKIVAEVIERFGQIDVLVNNAGFGITGAAEAYTSEQVRNQFDANLFGPIELTRAVLPHMRQQRSGNIINISSIGGRTTSIGLSIYQSAKFGLSGFSEALANEVIPLGIRVTAVEPGGIQTDWAGNSMGYADQVEGYESTVDARVDFFKSGKFVPKSDPAKIAAAIVALTDEPEPPVHLVLGSDAVGLLERSQLARQQEFEKWRHVSLSTDADIEIS
jgi:NAD(P)-dependent dehydrogenase (short-subunit alcohol dehydrogenase family)